MAKAILADILIQNTNNFEINLTFETQSRGKMLEQSSKPIRSYPYSISRSFFVTSLILFFGGGLCLFYFGWSHIQPPLYVFGSISFLVGILIWIRNSSQAEVSIFFDRIVIPYGFKYQKKNIILFDSITSVDEIKLNHISNIRISLKSDKPVLIQENLIQEKHFYEIFEFLEKQVIKNGPVYQSPVEVEAQKTKMRRLKVLLIGLPIALLIAMKLFTKQLNSINDWLGIVGLVGVVVGFEKAGSYLATRFGNVQKHERQLSKIEAKKIKNKWELLVYSPCLVAFVLLFILIKLPHEGSTNIWPFVGYSIATTCLFFLFLNKFLPHAKDLLSPFEQGRAFVLSGVFVGIVLVFSFIVININLDSSKGILKQSSLTGMFVPDKYPNDKCYRIAHWDTGVPISAGDSAYCTYTILNLRENDKVEFLLKDGFLGNPWIDDVVILKNKSVETLLDTLKNDLDLRLADIEYFAEQKGLTAWDKYSLVWDDKCKKEDFKYCRLSSYIYHIKGDSTNASKVLRKSCNHRDILSCYNLIAFGRVDKDELKKALALLRQDCEKALRPDEKEVCLNSEQIKIE